VPVYVAIGDPVHVGPSDDIHDASDALRANLQKLADHLQDIYPVDGTGKWWQTARRGGTAPSVDEVAGEVRGSRRPAPSDDGARD